MIKTWSNNDPNHDPNAGPESRDVDSELRACSVPDVQKNDPLLPRHPKHRPLNFPHFSKLVPEVTSSNGRYSRCSEYPDVRKVQARSSNPGSRLSGPEFRTKTAQALFKKLNFIRGKILPCPCCSRCGTTFGAFLSDRSIKMTKMVGRGEAS